MEDSKLLELFTRLSDALNEKGYALCVIRKPRPYTFRGLTAEQRYGENNVADRRAAMGLTMTALGKMMGVETMIIRRIENPDLKHTKTTMQKFASFFDCDIDDLLVKSAPHDFDNNGRRIGYVRAE